MKILGRNKIEYCRQNGEKRKMGEQSPFQSALADFTYDVASGGAIRHLTDLGYTARQISETLSYPTPMKRIQEQMWKRLLETETILAQEPGSPRETSRFVREYDKYGRTSFRMVSEVASRENRAFVTEIAIPSSEKERLSGLLQRKLSENEAKDSYAACDFGLLAANEPGKYRKLLAALDERDREYIEGLPWERKITYHKLNERMQKIMFRLLEADLWRGDCYFLVTGERVHLI